MNIGLIGLGSIGSVLTFKLLLNKKINLYVISGRNNTDIKLKDIRDDPNADILTSRKFNKIDIETLLNMTNIDIIIISGKINANQEIITKIKSAGNSLPPIILAQNGINNEIEFLDIPNIIIYRIVVSISAYITDDDVTVFNFFKAPLIYGAVSVSTSPNPKLVMDTLTTSGIETKEVNNKQLLSAIWTKGVVNCSLNALSGLYLSNMNILSKHSYILQIINLIIEESYAVAEKIGVEFDKNLVSSTVKNAPHNFSSMYKDIIQGKDTEIDYLNGMIVKLGKEHKIDTKMNQQITTLIKGLSHNIFSNNKLLCNEEFETVKKLFQNVKLIKFLKNYLNSIIKVLFNIGFDKNSFFSDDKHEMGNIGIGNPDENFTYILMPNVTIREKVNSIINSFFDSINRTPKQDAIILINYVFTHDNLWNKKRIEQLKKITGENKVETLYAYIFKNKLFDLWAPIIHIYPEFVFKRQLAKNLKPPATCEGWETQLIEPFSEKEKLFYGKDLKFHTGKCYYNDILNLIKKEDKCSIAGVSGHTLLLLELVKVLDINWKPMVLCALLTNVPYHHSIDEITRCIRIMNLNNSYKDISNKKLIEKIINEMLLEENIIKHNKDTNTNNGGYKISGKYVFKKNNTQKNKNIYPKSQTRKAGQTNKKSR